MNCPTCNFKNDADAKFCENCGNTLQAEGPTALKIETAKRHCSNCGKVNRAGIRFCENCGNPLDAQKVVKVEAKPAVQACSNCGTLNHPGLRFCENCGNSLQAGNSPVRQSAASTQKCSNCGKVNRSGIQFCENCGTSLASRQAAPQPQSVPKKSGAGIAGVFAGGMVALICFAVVFAFSLNNRSSPAKPSSDESYFEPQSNQNPPEPSNSSNPTSPSPLEPSDDEPPLVVDPPIDEPAPAEGDADAPTADNSFDDIPPKSDLEPFTGEAPEFPSGFTFGLTSYPDSDNDGLYDYMETWIAQSFAPYYIFDEKQQSRRPCGGLHELGLNISACLNSPGYMPLLFLYQVAPGEIDGVPHVLYIVTALYDLDYVEWDEDAGTSILWHYGDTESVEIYIQCDISPCNEGDFKVTGIQINRHGTGHWYYDSEVYFVDVYGNGNTDTGSHPILYIAQGKQAAYVTTDECHATTVQEPLPFKEDCNGWQWGVPDMSSYRYNVGSEDYPNPEADATLQQVFPGERIWDGNYKFCGGYQASDSFRAGTESFYGTDVENCAGTIYSKWWPLDVYAEKRQRPEFVSLDEIMTQDENYYTLNFINNSSDKIYCIDAANTTSSEPARRLMDYQAGLPSGWSYSFEDVTAGTYNLTIYFDPACQSIYEYVLNVTVSGDLTVTYP